MRVVEFNKEIEMMLDNKRIIVKPKCLYLFADVVWYSFKKNLIDLIITEFKANKLTIDNYVNQIIKLDKNIEQFLKKLNVNEIRSSKKIDKKKKRQKTNIIPIVVRTGGIGDLLALSSLCYNLPDFVNQSKTVMRFVSQEKYRAVFDWFEKPVNFSSYFTPLVKYSSNTVIERKKIQKRYKPIFFEGVIEESKDNWYNIQYNDIGVDNFKDEYGRPRLKTERINNNKSNIDNDTPSILINPRSTAIIRSMRFEEFYKAIINCIDISNVNIYVHRQNLRKFDIDFINNSLDDRIKIIETINLEQFFLDIFDATFCLSVDTAMFHFREGIKKPALGIYSAFTTNSRTKYYKYTKSIDIMSDCPEMPCFTHVKQAGEICNFQRKLMELGEFYKEYREVAPCTCMVWNKTIVEQITEPLKDELNKLLDNDVES